MKVQTHFSGFEPTASEISPSLVSSLLSLVNSYQSSQMCLDICLHNESLVVSKSKQASRVTALKGSSK